MYKFTSKVISFFIILFLFFSTEKTFANSYTMNPAGGTTSSNEVRIIVGDWGQAQVYYKGKTQIYGGNTSSRGNGGPNLRMILKIGTTSVGKGFTSWTNASTSGTSNGNKYNATTVMTYVKGGKTYKVTIYRNYIAPNMYFTWKYKVEVPAGNTENIKFYMGMDSYVAGGDSNDTGYKNDNPSKTVGIYDSSAKVLSAQRYIDGPTWTGYEASGRYDIISTRIKNNQNYNNTVKTTSGDFGYGINRDFGTTGGKIYEGTNQWRFVPYITTNVFDLIPSIGQAQPNLEVNKISNVPIVITNAGNINATGNTTLTFTVPNNFSGPTNSFSSNSWSCSATDSSSKVTCTKNINIASLGSENINIPLKPLPAAAGTTVKLTASVSNSSDYDATNNSATNSQLVSVASQSLQLHFKGNYGTNCTSFGCSINSWDDYSGLKNNATRPSGSNDTITYNNSRYNFNPAIIFDISSGQNKKGLSGVINGGIKTKQASVFYIGKIYNNGSTKPRVISLPENTTSNDRDKKTSFNIARENGTNTIMTIQDNTMRAKLENTFGLDTISGFTYGSGPNSKAYLNGELKSTTTHTLGTLNINNFFLGANSEYTHYTKMDLAEILVFNKELTDKERNILNSYLSIKYGLSLVENQNYYLSDETLVWDNSQVGAYKKNVSGIGYDNTTGLDQTKTKNYNNIQDILVEDISTPKEDKQILMWGNNGLSQTETEAISGITGAKKTKRNWYFRENSADIGNVKISIHKDNLPEGFDNYVYMGISQSGTFDNNSTYITGTLNTSTNYWEFTKNINSGDYISFAKIVNDTTSPTVNIIFPENNIIFPNGVFVANINYSDDTSVDTSKNSISLYKYNGTNWGSNIASSFITSNSTSNSNAKYNIAKLGFGKYKLYFSVKDSSGNTGFSEKIFYIDEPELIISTGSIDIGILSSTGNTFSPEITITVKTVGAAFDVLLNKQASLSYNTLEINDWDGNNGFGYDKETFSDTINLIGTDQIIKSETKNINTSGNKNIYTYKVKLGAKVQAEQAAGNYLGNIKFGIKMNY